MSNIDRELDIIKDIGNEDIKSALFKKEEKLLGYHKDRLLIGIEKETGRLFYLDVSEAFRAFVVGMVRTGKSFLLRAMSDRLYRMGHCIVYLTDVKDEMKSSNYPLQKKFHHLLAEGEKPAQTPILTFRPTFFKSLTRFNELPEDNEWYSPKISEMEKPDFMTLFHADKLTQNQKIHLEEVYDELKKVECEDLEMIEEIIDKFDKINEKEKAAFLYKFKPMIKSDFFITEYHVDLVHMISNRLCIAFNMENFDSFGRSNSLPQAFVSMTLRELIKARKAGLIPKIMFMIDEAKRFVPSDAHPSTRLEVEESVDIDGRYDVSYVIAAQGFADIPDKVIKQCRYMFIPYNANLDVFKEAFKTAGLMKNIQTLNNQVVRIKQNMQRHEWLVIDRNSQGFSIIRPVAPLSHHMETGE